jgi:hypothetical protein
VGGRKPYECRSVQITCYGAALTVTWTVRQPYRSVLACMVRGQRWRLASSSLLALAAVLQRTALLGLARSWSGRRPELASSGFKSLAGKSEAGSGPRPNTTAVNSSQIRRFGRRPEAVVAGPLVSDCQIMLIRVPAGRPGRLFTIFRR